MAEKEKDLGKHHHEDEDEKDKATSGGAGMPGGIVTGSVMERAFIGGDLPAALFAASVPLNEVAAEAVIGGDSDVRHLVAEVLAVPSNTLLDEAQYRTLATRLTGQDWPRRWLRYGPSVFWEESLSAWERREAEVRKEIESNERPIHLFAQHSIALMVAGERGVGPYWLAVPLPPDEFRKNLDLETDEAALATGIACLSARLQRSQRTADFTRNVLQYDLPFGNSPRASSDSLIKLLDSGKKMCLAPVAAGGTVGITQLAQGQYVAAILSVGTGSVMTLILLGTVAVGSLLVARVAQRRGRGSAGKA